MDNQKENKTPKKHRIAVRNIVVFLTILIVGIGLIIAFRTEYLNIKEIYRFIFQEHQQ